MSVLLSCLLITVVMPMLAKLPLIVAMHRAGGYDNRHPRAQQASLTGFGARAKACHENCFEAITLFTPGVLALLALNAVSDTSATLAIIFVVARLCYCLCYWIDQDKLRSLAWVVGFACSLALLIQAINHVTL
ncbi:MAPEG family protein [Aestuariibacter salexigens]|uniref:MAPEG family protein n=1 Tax=Aestuariibacter salexigens TaxID=226010 RepID=UPI0004070939|nr:MAPEG family protein [Aestuariibacter salexigens]